MDLRKVRVFGLILSEVVSLGQLPLLACGFARLNAPSVQNRSMHIENYCQGECRLVFYMQGMVCMKNY